MDLRSLDARVAERVFDRNVCRTEADIPRGWRLDEGQRLPGYLDGTLVHSLPDYTTSWQAAGQVVERMNDMGWVLFCWASLDRTNWYVQFHDVADGTGFQGRACNFPEAICRAALAAVDAAERAEQPEIQG